MSDRTYRAAKQDSETNVLYFYPENKYSYYQDSFLPMIEMTFDHKEDGASINIFAKFNRKINNFLAKLVLYGLVLGAFLLLPCIRHNDFTHFYFFIPEIMAVAAYLLFCVYLYISTKCFQMKLKKYLAIKTEYTE